jgi:hypothetical protein
MFHLFFANVYAGLWLSGLTWFTHKQVFLLRELITLNILKKDCSPVLTCRAMLIISFELR